MPSGLALALAGLVVAGLSFVFTGVLARPMVVAGVLLFLQGAFGPNRPARRVLRVWAQTNAAMAIVAAVVVVGAVGVWATLPFFQRRAALVQIDVYSQEGHRLEQDLLNRPRSQPLSDLTSRVQDWHQRLEHWVGEDLGTFYRARLGTPQAVSTYPPNLHPNLQVFWDVLETDLGTLTTFETELSRWLF